LAWLFASTWISHPQRQLCLSYGKGRWSQSCGGLVLEEGAFQGLPPGAGFDEILH
jgi:hypothetical protein